MTIKQRLQKLTRFVGTLPLKTKILSGVVLLFIVSYAFIFGLPKQVAFDYSAEVCARQLTLFPGMQKQGGKEGFTVELRDKFSIGNLEVGALKTCFVATEPPTEGSYRTTVSPFGGVIAAKQYSLEVAKMRSVSTNSFVGKTIPTGRPLTLQLDGPDTVYTYKFKVADKSVDCEPKDSTVLCRIEKLNLAHGAAFEGSVERYFNATKINEVSKGSFKTMLPLLLVNGSLTDGQIVYDKPASFSFEYDDTVAKADLVLQQKNGEALEKVPAATSYDGKKLVVTPKDALKREAQFVLTLKTVEAEDGNTTPDPYIVNFTMSGGPKVKSVSVGGSNVKQSEQIIVTFDQPLSDDVDVTKLAKITGANAAMKKVSETEVSFGLQNAALCTAFTLTIDKGVKSGSNDETSTEPWSFNSRTICGYSSVIGYSVKGRPIVAYYFGSGATTILFTGGIHGSEQSGYSTMQAFVTWLQSNAYTIPANKRIVVVPNTNPDGIAAGTRYNANNVNLGRNFPTANWSASIETASGTLPTGGGTSPGSEPEVRALITLVQQLRPRLSMSFHAQGSLVGANKFADSVAIGDIYARTVGYGTMYYNAEEVMGYPITGEMEDWMGESMNIPAVLIELPRTSGNYFPSQQSAIQKIINV